MVLKIRRINVYRFDIDGSNSERRVRFDSPTTLFLVDSKQRNTLFWKVRDRETVHLRPLPAEQTRSRRQLGDVHPLSKLWLQLASLGPWTKAGRGNPCRTVCLVFLHRRPLIMPPRNSNPKSSHGELDPKTPKNDRDKAAISPVSFPLFLFSFKK